MITRPLLRYFGGKFAIAPWIIENMPEHRIYVEPFGGGGSILLCKPKTYCEVYNDLDGDICNVFRQMRDNFDKLSYALRRTPFAREEYDMSYLETDCDLERARRTLVRSWMGFGNSAQRAGGKTGFQAMTEFTGSSKAAQWSTWQDTLETFKERLRGVVVENRNALEVIDQQDTKDTLFLLDPPYVPDTRKSGIYKFEMTADQHLLLCEKIKSVKGMVMLCGYENDIYDSMSWHKIKRESRSMANTTDAVRTECLWFNKSAMDNLPQKSLL